MLPIHNTIVDDLSISLKNIYKQVFIDCWIITTGTSSYRSEKFHVNIKLGLFTSKILTYTFDTLGEYDKEKILAVIPDLKQVLLEEKNFSLIKPVESNLNPSDLQLVRNGALITFKHNDGTDDVGAIVPFIDFETLERKTLIISKLSFNTLVNGKLKKSITQKFFTPEDIISWNYYSPDIEEILSKISKEN